MQARLVAVLFQGFAEFGRARGFGQARQRPDHLRLGVIQVAKLVKIRDPSKTRWPYGFSWGVWHWRSVYASAVPPPDEVQSPRMVTPAEAGLVRAIGTRQLTASIINTTIGAGIFVLPAVAAAGLGAAAPMAYIVCAVLMALIVCCVAAAGSRVSLTGGLYAYVGVAFGPLFGFLAGVLYFLMATFAVASVASAFAGSVGALWPGATTPVARAILIVVLFAGLAAVNVRGVKPGVGLVEAMTIAKLLPLVTLVAVGIWFVNPEYSGGRQCRPQRRSARPPSC